MLIVTNGDSAAERIRSLGLGADVLPWRDVLHDGPVRPLADLAAQSRDRAAFLAEMSGRDAADIAADMAARDKRFLSGCADGVVELWFEHDLYDQLQLAQILAAAPDGGDVRLVQADLHLTALSDAEFARLPATAEPVTAQQIDEAKAVWAAFRAPDPTGLLPYAERASALPHMAAALRRVLAEFPDSRTGLPLSLVLALELLRGGSMRLGRLFGEAQARETAAFMGDLSFWRVIDDIAQARRPLIAAPDGARLRPIGLATAQEFRQEAALTVFGRRVLAGEANHVLENGIDRWIGGVRLTTETGFFYERNGADGSTAAGEGGMVRPWKKPASSS